jgi:hypothetical protein
MSSAELIPHPGVTQHAFTLDNFKSVTLDGLWIAGFRSMAPFTGSDDGMPSLLTNVHGACKRLHVATRSCYLCQKLGSQHQELFFHQQSSHATRSRSCNFQLELQHQHSRQRFFKSSFHWKRRDHLRRREFQRRHSSQLLARSCYMFLVSVLLFLKLSQVLFPTTKAV